MHLKGLPLLCLLILLSGLSCQKGETISGSDNEEPTYTPQELTDEDRVGLIWSDEFDQNQLDSEFWTYDLGDGSAQDIPGWGNGESQTYTDRSENLTVENGFLTITARKESYQNKSYTSARIKTQSKFSFTYGKVVVRAVMPNARGSWPAVWFMGESITEVSWPRCGEIDLVEQNGQDKDLLLGTTHWLDEASSQNASYSRSRIVEGLTSSMNVYTMEWSPTFIKMFINDTLYYEIALNDQLPFDAPFFVLLNVAMGGSLGGTIDPAFSMDSMIVDYVRVYEL